MQNVPRTPIKKYKRRGSTPLPFWGDTVIEPTIASWWQDNLFHSAFISGLYLEARTYFQGRFLSTLSRSLAEKCHVFFFLQEKYQVRVKWGIILANGHIDFFFFRLEKWHVWHVGVFESRIRLRSSFDLVSMFSSFNYKIKNLNGLMRIDRKFHDSH